MSAKVDYPDWVLVSPYRWHAAKRRKTTYAVATQKPKGRNVSILMHRLLMGSRRGQVVDHINGDGLDNRRCNLRHCTTSLNVYRGGKPKGQSGYIGVWKDSRKGLWTVMIRDGPKRRWLGRFKDKKAAARRYDEEARLVWGNEAILNFPRRRKGHR